MENYAVSLKSGLSRLLRKFIVLTVGITVLLLGILMIFLPGPAVIVLPIGLLILATEFVWAKQLLERGKEFLKKRKK